MTTRLLKINYLRYTFCLLLLQIISIIGTSQSSELTLTDTLYTREIGLTAIDRTYFVGLNTFKINKSAPVNLLRYNSTAELQERIEINAVDTDFDFTCNDILGTSDKGLLLVGPYRRTDAQEFKSAIIKLDTLGNIQWAKKLNLPFASSMKLFPINQDSILISMKYNNGSFKQLIGIIDEDGNFINHQNYFISSEINTIHAYEDYFEIIYIYGYVVRMSYDLKTVLSRKKFKSEIGFSYNTASNGDQLIATTTTLFPGFLSVMRKTQDGQMLWSKYFESYEGDQLTHQSVFDIVGIHFIKENQNGDIFVSANSEGGIDGSFQITLDKDGNYLGNSKTISFNNRMLPLNQDHYLRIGFSQSVTIGRPSLIFEKVPMVESYSCDQELTVDEELEIDVELDPEHIMMTENDSIEFEEIHFTSQSLPYQSNVYCSISSSEDVESINQLSIYPNPTNSILTIDTPKKFINYTIYSMQGDILKAGQHNIIDVQEFNQGIYIIQIELFNQIVNKKFLKVD